MKFSVAFLSNNIYSSECKDRTITTQHPPPPPPPPHYIHDHDTARAVLP